MLKYENGNDRTRRQTKSKPRVHKRTILFVALVVFLPWLLVSIPRDIVKEDFGLATNIDHSQHGWPFIQMYSTHYDLHAHLIDGNVVSGNPASIDTKPLAIKRFNKFFHSPQRDSKLLEFDLRLAKSKWGEFGYWSDAENWILWGEEHYFEIQWLGLLANLLLGSIVAVIVGWPIEKRIRSGTLFRYSLFSFGVVVTLLCLGLTFAVGTYRSFLAEQSFIQKLEQLEYEDLAWAEIEYTDRFPRVISQLINGGYRPWGDLQISRMYSDTTLIEIDFDDGDDQQMEKLLKILEHGNPRLSIDLSQYNERNEKYLKKLDAHRIAELEISYDAYNWLENRIGEDFYDISIEEAMRRAPIPVNLDLKLQHVEEVRIFLWEYFTAKEQLEPFLDLPPQTRLFIDGVDDDAVEFLIQTEARWPNFQWTGFDVSSELRQKMSQRFEEVSGGYQH